MKPQALMICALLAGTMAPSLAGAEGNVNFTIGLRDVDNDIWHPVDNQLSGGVNVDWGRLGAPVHLSVGLHFSEGKEHGPGPGLFGFLAPVVEVEGKIRELSVGAEKIWIPRESTARPFIGGGVAHVMAKIREARTGLSDRDDSIGYYLRGGIFWAHGEDRPGPLINYGLEIRLLAGTDIEFRGVKGDADYVQYGFLFGVGW